MNNFFCSTITGSPFDDANGRWRIGGGINVAVKNQVWTSKCRAKELKRELGIRSSTTH